jgi:hypothetical protein
MAGFFQAGAIDKVPGPGWFVCWDWFGYNGDYLPAHAKLLGGQ